VTRDLDTLLRDADPLRARSDDDAALLRAVRQRVDRERADVRPAHLRPRWSRRVVLIAAAAALLTAVPLVLSVVLGDDGDENGILPASVAANGEISCGGGYASAVAPQDSPVRLLPDRVPPGWSYTKIFVRSDTTAGCVPPSLTALREAADGTVTGRISVTGPVEARVNQGKIVAASVPDTLFGNAARRFDLQPFDVAFHRWFWTDDQGRRWSVEASGMPLKEARQDLAAVSISGSDVAWNAAAAPRWTLVHLREGAPYGVSGQLNWSVEMTDGSTRRFLDVSRPRGVKVPLLASTAVGDQVTTVDGHPAVLGRVRVNQAPPGTETDTPPGSVTRPVLVELSPGTVAFSFAMGDDLPEVERMLASLRQVPRDDPRLERYGED
jgi:hypothetical protein